MKFASGTTDAGLWQRLDGLLATREGQGKLLCLTGYPFHRFCGMAPQQSP